MIKWKYENKKWKEKTEKKKKKRKSCCAHWKNPSLFSRINESPFGNTTYFHFPESMVRKMCPWWLAEGSCSAYAKEKWKQEILWYLQTDISHSYIVATFPENPDMVSRLLKHQKYLDNGDKNYTDQCQLCPLFSFTSQGSGLWTISWSENPQPVRLGLRWAPDKIRLGRIKENGMPINQFTVHQQVKWSGRPLKKSTGQPA